MKLNSKTLNISISLTLLLAIISIQSAQAAIIPPDSTADVVYGQMDFISSISATDAESLDYPYGVVLDKSGNLYVADHYNHRVLFYQAGSTRATRVYGQKGDFTSSVENKDGIGAESLYFPSGVALDNEDNLYVADTYNHRVLFYPAGTTVATRVYGQGNDFTTNINNKDGISVESLYFPYGVVLDTNNNLYVADTYNNRILYFPAGSTTATRVYGQGGDFTSNVENKSGVSAESLYFPHDITLDIYDNLYVADLLNHRVLYFPAESTIATSVYGQMADFSSNIENRDGVSANSLAYPSSVALDSIGGLYVADYQNHRVLYFPPGSTTAVYVYGQGDNFTTNTNNKDGISAESLSRQRGLALDTNSNLYVADSWNNRVLKFSVHPFVDVLDSYWAGDYIERLHNAGITGGCRTSPLNYCPEASVTRAQMAIFLEKGKAYPSSFSPPDVPPTFTDTVGHWAEDWIEALKNDGITSGCGIGLYCPEAPVTRAQMAVFLLKAKHGSSYSPPPVGTSTGFGDIPTNHWAAAWIKQLVAEGITSGCGSGIYCPDTPVTRAQMAVFLVKTFGLP